MKRIIFILTTVLLMVGCSSDIMEDEDYIHVKKTQVYCKLMESKVVEYTHRGGSSYKLEEKFKCMYINEVKTDYDLSAIKRKEELKKLLDN